MAEAAKPDRTPLIISSGALLAAVGAVGYTYQKTNELRTQQVALATEVKKVLPVLDQLTSKAYVDMQVKNLNARLIKMERQQKKIDQRLKEFVALSATVESIVTALKDKAQITVKTPKKKSSRRRAQSEDEDSQEDAVSEEEERPRRGRRSRGRDRGEMSDGELRDLVD